MAPRLLVAITVLVAVVLILALTQLFESPTDGALDEDASDEEAAEHEAAQLTGSPGRPARAPEPGAPPEKAPVESELEFGGGGNVGFNGLLREDIKALGGFETTPEGTLGGLLLDGKEPFSGAEALLWTKGTATGRGGIPVAKTPKQSALIARDGTFSFSHLDAGWYFVGVREPGGPARLAMEFLNPLTESKRVVVVLGTATVHGIVYHDGRPHGNESVRIEVKGERGVSTTLVETRADEAGRYEITRLLGGHATMKIGRGGNFDFPLRTMRFTLKPGERRRVDPGKPKR